VDETKVSAMSCCAVCSRAQEIHSTEVRPDTGHLCTYSSIIDSLRLAFSRHADIARLKNVCIIIINLLLLIIIFIHHV